MEDQSAIGNNSKPHNTVSKGLQNFIDSMVEEIVLEGKTFDSQKKYLRKYSENEGVNYEELEKDLTTFIELLDSLKSSFSKVLIRVAQEKATACHLSEETVTKLLNYSVENANNKVVHQPTNVGNTKKKKAFPIYAIIALVAFVLAVCIIPNIHGPYSALKSAIKEANRIELREIWDDVQLGEIKLDKAKERVEFMYRLSDPDDFQWEKAEVDRWGEEYLAQFIIANFAAAYQFAIESGSTEIDGEKNPPMYRAVHKVIEDTIGSELGLSFIIIGAKEERMRVSISLEGAKDAWRNWEQYE